MENKSILSNFIWRLAERFGAQLVTLIVSIILARLLDPEVYGVVALVTVFTTILQVFVDSGLGTALVQKKDADDLDFSSVFYFNIVACSVLYIGLFLCAPLIAEFYNISELTPIVRVLGLTVLISGVKNIQQSYVARNMMFKKFFFATLIGTVSAAVVGVLLAYNGFGVWALVIQNLVNLTIDTIVLWCTVKWRPIFRFSFDRLKMLLNFGWKILASALLDTAYKEVRSLIIGKQYTPSDLAYYNNGNKYPKYLVENIDVSINSVLLTAMSNEQDNPLKVKELTRKSLKLSTFIIMPMMLGLFACAESVVTVVLTEKWLPCVFYLRIACIVFCFYPIHTINLNVMKSLGRSDYVLKLEIIKKIVVLIVLFATVFISVEVMALSALFTVIIGVAINTYPNRKLINYGMKEQLVDILPNITLSVSMAIITFFVKFLVNDMLLLLLIQIVVGIVVYCMGARVFRFESFRYITSYLKDIICKFYGEK